MENLLNNLIFIAIVFCLYVLSVLANIVVSVYYNTKTLGQDFKWNKFKDGLLKMLFIGVGSAILAVAITLSANYITSAETADIVTIATLVALYSKAILKYINEATNTIDDILNNRNIIDDVNKSEESEENSNG